MAVEVVYTDEFNGWWDGLSGDAQDAVAIGVGVFEQKGVSLDYPRCSAIKGSKYALRELRIQHQGRPLRVFYAFDPKRQAVLLIGGDKTGRTDAQFYLDFIPKAEAIWEVYLDETK